MVNNLVRSDVAALLLALAVLTAAAWLRGAEYDEQYTLFLTAGTARPVWPEGVFPAGTITAVQVGQASLASIAHDLRTTDVHPPLYFWAVSFWRALVGPGLFVARMFSILCGLVSLGAIGSIARRCGIRPWMAVSLTLGSYGFVYTNIVDRGFAPAHALILCGVALLARRTGRSGAVLAGMLLGAACGCNYLAVFVAAAVILASRQWLAVAGALPFLALDAWFFAAQRGTRAGQFPPFSLHDALPWLGTYQVATVFGGLPLYCEGSLRLLVGGSLGLLMFVLAGAVLLKAAMTGGPRISLLLAAAVAPALGLLLLGAVFNNTPIELRYLSFSAPFIALLTAWLLGRLGLVQRTTLAVVLTVQLASIVGLMFGPATMQPARATAAAAARLAKTGVVLLPRGNDGVGIVGAFGVEAPASLPVLLVSPEDTPALLRQRVGGYQRVVLALLAQDRDSRASIPAMRSAFAGPDWRRVATGFNVEVYERIAQGT